MLPCSQKMKSTGKGSAVYASIKALPCISHRGYDHRHWSSLALSGCRAQPAPLQDALADYEKVLKTDGLDGLRLSVYYIDPSILTRSPLTEGQPLSFESVQKFEVDNAQLLQHIELLKTINAEELDAGFEPFCIKCTSVLYL